MTTPFEEVYNRGPQDFRDILDAWCEGVFILGGGADIVANLKEERQIEPPLFSEFLNDLAKRYQALLASGANPEHPRRSYERGCETSVFRFKGIESTVAVSTHLHTVLDLEAAQILIENAMDVAKIGDDDEPAWDQFWDERVLTDDERLEYLRKVLIFVAKKETVWAYFNLVGADHGTTINPLAGRTADEYCVVLGLPPHWRPYRYGTRLFRLCYTVTPTLTRHVPTTVDANSKGWNPYFEPVSEERADAKWGLTRPLGEERGKKNGQPEIVHVAGSPVSLTNLPEDLGERRPKAIP